MKSENSIYLDPDDLKEYEYVGSGLFTINYLCDFKGNKVKVELGICKGKKLYDKREDIAKKDAEMYIKRHLKE